jgi:SAM-dependent methyltransferase
MWPRRAIFDPRPLERHKVRMTTSPNVTAGPPRIFDRALGRMRLARAMRFGAATFLLERVVADMGERLDAILRPFPSALDLSTPGPQLASMLVAREGERAITRLAPISQTLGDGPWTGIVGDEEALPFASESFDLIASALALQYVNDLPGALTQARRALAPDGLFLACMIGGRSLEELRIALAIAEDEIVGGVSPRVAPLADIRDLGGLLQRAGFALPVVDLDHMNVRYANVFGLMADLRAMGATNALEQRLRKPTRRAVFLRAAQIYADRFADLDGRVRATFEIIWLSGWAPHESQQKPLAPGSAKMRLADALGTKEQKV